MRNQLYLVSDDGHIFASKAYPPDPMEPLNAMMFLSVGSAPLRARIDGVDYQAKALVVRRATVEPLFKDVPTVGFFLYPQHPLYRAINASGTPSAMVLPRRLFDKHNELLAKGVDGRLTMSDAKKLFKAVLEILATRLPGIPPLDSRIEKSLQLLLADPALRIEDLGSAVGLSTNYLSTLFSKTMGIDLRLCRLALRLNQAIRSVQPGKSLTEIAQELGFTDSPHASKACRERFGATPTFFIENTDFVR
jgi:AraC-like DNA-binding protein